MAVVYFFGSTIDQYVLESDNLWWQALLVLGTFLILSPQPRPRNPTFIQNALLCGLIIGAALGALEHQPALHGLARRNAAAPTRTDPATCLSFSGRPTVG